MGGEGYRLADEIRYIIRRAADHDGRIVTVGQRTVFSSETGDAWIIGRDTQIDASATWGARGRGVPNVVYSAGISRRF